MIICPECRENVYCVQVSKDYFSLSIINGELVFDSFSRTELLQPEQYECSCTTYSKRELLNIAKERVICQNDTNGQ